MRRWSGSSVSIPRYVFRISSTFLALIDVLKTWPVRAAAVVRGEIAWPATVITGIAWALGAIALFFSAAVFEQTGLVWRTAVGIAALILTPALVAAQYTIHNAAALIFPA